VNDREAVRELINTLIEIRTLCPNLFQPISIRHAKWGRTLNRYIERENCIREHLEKEGNT